MSIAANHGGASAYGVPGDHPLLLAVEEAVTAAAGEAPIRVRMGSSLPLTDIVKRQLHLDTVMLSYSTADEDFHAPNEFLRLSAIDEGMTAWVKLLRLLADQSPEQYSRFTAS